MTLKQLATEIEKLKPGQRDRLLKILEKPAEPRKRRNASDDPLARIIGIAHVGRSGAADYKRDLYGGDQPL